MRPIRSIIASGRSGGGAPAIVTWSPTDKNADIALSGGNLIATRSSGASTWISGRATAGHNTGIHYFQVVVSGTGANTMIGLGDSTMSLSNFPGSSSAGTSIGYYALTGNRFSANGGNPYGASYTNGDVIGVKYDTVAQEVTFYKNGASQGAISYSTSSIHFPAIGMFDGAGAVTLTGQFSAADIGAGLPSGASAWQ